MTCGLRQRSLLSPSRHSPVDQLRIACHAGLGADAKPFAHTRSEPFDEDIAGADEVQQNKGRFRMFQINGHRPFASIEHVETRIAGDGVRWRRPLESNHVGSHVGEHHSAERSWPE